MKQFNPEKSPLIIRFSKIISNFFNPLTALFIYFVYSSSLQYNLSETAKLFLPLLLIVVIPISAWIYWNVRKGNYSNMDVSNRKQRKSLYFFIATTLFLFLFYDYFFNENIDLIVTFLLLLLLLGIIWFLIAVLVGVTRIILKRHTVIEVISGALIALLVSFIYLYANIQYQH